MLFRAPLAFVVELTAFLELGCTATQTPTDQNLTQLCNPSVSQPIVVTSVNQRYDASLKAEPPLTDSFIWSDTPIGVLKAGNTYTFFGSDGGYHQRQPWQGGWAGNDKWGSVVKTTGTLDNPLGSGTPQDVSISPNPDSSTNPSYPIYTYMGGGPVFQVPAGMTGAGNLLVTYHSELPADVLYPALGLAASWDNGLHWTDLGEIIRLNQAYAVGLDGFDIGDGPLVLSQDSNYFYLYFPDWIANGTLHTYNAEGVSTVTHVSVARALVASVLDAAFGSTRPHMVPFEKFYQGSWEQPGIGGASTDLNPDGQGGYLDVHYNTALQRYVMIISNDIAFYYAESLDGLTWTIPVSLGTFGPIAAYPTAVGLGDDPHVLGNSFYVYYTYLPTSVAEWASGTMNQLTVTCQ